MFKKIIQDKSAGEKILSFFWFVVIVGVAGAIAIAVIFHSSADINVKEIQAKVLYHKLSDCIQEKGVLREEFIKEDFDVFSFCSLNKDAFIGKEPNIYFEIVSSDLQKDISGGDAGLKGDCAISKETKAEKYPKCFFQEQTLLYSTADGIKEAKVNIYALSNQEGEGLSNG
ncbi:MAG: hypothetical protein AABX30_03530 [Nanoarchaeota archaeon]